MGGFPRSFTFLRSYIGRLTRRTSDDKVHIINTDFATLLSRIDGSIDLPDAVEPAIPPATTTPALAPAPVGAAAPTLLPIERVSSSSASQLDSSTDSPVQRTRTKMAADKRDLLLIAEKLLAALDGNGPPAAVAEIFEQSQEDKLKEEREAILRSTLPRANPQTVEPRPQRQRRGVEVMAPLQLLLSVLCSAVHTLKSPLAKTTLLDLFVAFSVELDDDCRLQRIVPYVRLLLSDPAAVVRAAGLRALMKVVRDKDEDLQFPMFVYLFFKMFDSLIWSTSFLHRNQTFSPNTSSLLSSPSVKIQRTLCAKSMQRILRTSLILQNASLKKLR